MGKSKVISVGIAVDLQNIQETSGKIQSMSKDLANMKLDKDLEPRLKSVEKTLAGAVKQIGTMTEKIDVLSKAGGLDPKTLSDLSMLATAIADVKVEVDALSSRMNNFSKELSNVGDVGVKQVAGNITKEIGNMATGINTSLNNATKSIQEGGEKLKIAYENMLDNLNEEIVIAEDKITHGDSVKASQIFKISDEDELKDKVKKIKNTLQKDLKDLANATANYTNAKTSGADIEELEKFASAQVKAISQLKEHFVAFYNFEELDEMSGMKLPKGMQTLVNDITNSFGDLKGQSFKTFEEIYDFIDSITNSIRNDITSNLKLIQTSMSEVVQVEAVTEKEPSKEKTKKKKDTKEKETYTGVVLKEGMEAELIAELKTVINNLQKFVNAHPIELDAVINPTWGTAQTTKYLKSIREQLSKKNANIDENLAARIYGLQDAFGKDFSDALNRSIEKLKTNLSKEGFTVGKLKIADSTISDFKQQLTDAIGSVEVNISANVQDAKYVGRNSDPELLNKVNNLFDRLRNADKYDVDLIKELVALIKDNNLNVDFSDAYKDQIKNIVKGLVEGTYMSVPEAISKNKAHWGETPQGEFTKNRHLINELIEKINNEKDPQKTIGYQQELAKLYARNQEIVSQLMNEVKVDEETQPISEITQQAEKVVVNTSNATINIDNANAVFKGGEIKTEETKKENNTEAITEDNKNADAELLANRNQLIRMASARFNELINKEELDLEGIDALVKDIKKTDLHFESDKFTNTTTGKIVDMLLKGEQPNANAALKALYKQSPDVQAKTMAAQMQHQFFEGFKKLYAKETIQDKGTASEKSIQMFVDKVRKSGYDFKVAPQYQNNEIGKLINSMLTEGYKTVADAINAKENKSVEDVKPKQQKIDKSEININNATINITEANIKTKEQESKTTDKNKSSNDNVDNTQTNINNQTVPKVKTTNEPKTEAQKQIAENLESNQELSEQLFKEFKRLYNKGSVNEGGTVTDKTIDKFVNKVFAANLDKFIIPDVYRDNEVGKSVYAKLAGTGDHRYIDPKHLEALDSRVKNVEDKTSNINKENKTKQSENKKASNDEKQKVNSVSIDTTKVTISSPSEVKITGTQRIAEATQKISNATIEITNGKSTTNTVEKDKTNKSENKPVESNNNSNKNIDSKSKKLLDEYNNNVSERGNLSFGDYLYKQGQILSKLQNNNVDVKKSQTNSIKHYQEYIDEINKIVNTTTDNVLKEQLIQIRTNLIDNADVLNTPITSDNAGNAQDAIQNILKNVNAFNEISAGLNQKAKEINNLFVAMAKIDLTIDKGDGKNLSEAAQETIIKAKNRISELENILVTAKQNNDYSGINIEDIAKELTNLQGAVGEAINQTVVDKLDVKGLIRKLDNLQIDEVKTDPAVMARVKELRRQLQAVVDDDAREMLTEEYKGIFKEISQLSGTVSKSDRTFFGNFMKEWRHKNYQMLAQFFSFYDIIRYMREAVNVVKQYDTALIEMMKVSDETRFSLERYQRTLFDTADAIGSSALTLEQSTADWMRIGESLTEAAESAKAAQILMNVSEFQDINSATQALVSASQAYAELDKMEIVDKINKLGNEFPIATDQLATALQNSAAALTTQGNSLEEALALVVGGNIITQDALKTGTGIRTIALRIAGTKEAKDELAELGEGVDDFVVRTESKTRKLIMDYTAVASNGFKGVDIYNDNGNLRSTYEIMQDIADIYKEIQLEDRQAGTNRANALVELLAGKNRSNIAASILTNPDTIREAYEAAQNAEGSAMRENEKYLTSVEAHITMFKNAVDELITSLVDSGFINDVIDFGTTLVKILKEITDAIGGVGTVLAGIGIGTAAKFHVFKDKDYGLLTAIKTIANQPLGQEVNNVTKDIEGLEGAIVSTEGATMALGTAWKTVFGFGIIAAASIAISVIAAYAKSVREAQQAVRDLAKDNKTTNDSLDEYAKRIAEARKVIDDERSSTEEIRNAKNELITIQDELNLSYDNYSQILKDTNADLEEQNQLLIENALLKNKETINAAKDTGNHWIDSEFNKAIEEFESSAYLIDSYVAADYLKKYSELFTESMVADSNGEEVASTFFNSTGNKNDDIRLLTQLRNSITGEDKASQAAIKEINRIIDDMNQAKDEYEDIYLAYGQNTAADDYNDEYNSLMQAYFDNVQNGTEETEQVLKDNLSNLWSMAASENNAGVQYWLKSMFGEFFDTIEDIDFQAKWNEVVDGQSRGDKINRMVDIIQSGSEKDEALSADQIRQYLSGTDISASDRQKEWLDMLKDYVNENGLLIDDVIRMLTEEGKVRVGDGKHTLEEDIESYRQQATQEMGMSEQDWKNLGITTDEQLTKWKDIIAVTNDAEKAAKMYFLAMSDIGNVLDSNDILKNMQEQYKPAFDALAESYKEIFTNGKYNGVDKITAANLENVRAQFESVNNKLKEAGMDLIPDDEINKFLETLSTEEILNPEEFATKAEEVHAAYNNVATVVVDSLNPALKNASFESINLMKKQLEDLGVTNAEAVIFTRLGYTVEEAADAMANYEQAKKDAEEIGFDIDDDISSLDEEKIKAILDSEALMDYYRHKLIAMAINIDTTQDCRALLNLAKTLGLAKLGVLDLAEAEAKLAQADSLRANAEALRNSAKNYASYNSFGASSYISAAEKLEEKAGNIEDEVQTMLSSAAADVDFASVDLNGEKNKSSSTSDKGKDTKQKFDWIERAIKKIQRAVTNLGKVADATYKTWGERLDAIMGKTEEFHDEIGQFGRGNIDLYNRPQYINEDGSVSTVRSVSFGDESGYEILVPTIAFDNNGNPYSMSDDEAIARYYETGEYLGLFKSIEEAEEYAEKLHEQQEAIYLGGGDTFYAGKYQKLKEEIALQEQAAAAYMAEANAIGLSAEYRSKVMNGLMDIETVTDETLKEQISDFQELYLNMQPYLMMVWKIILIAGNPQRQLHYNMTMKYA